MKAYLYTPKSHLKRFERSSQQQRRAWRCSRGPEALGVTERAAETPLRGFLCNASMGRTARWESWKCHVVVGGDVQQHHHLFAPLGQKPRPRMSTGVVRVVGGRP
ncbi:unnamed protein product [Lampetra fluviatilis]